MNYTRLAERFEKGPKSAAETENIAVIITPGNIIWRPVVVTFWKAAAAAPQIFDLKHTHWIPLEYNYYKMPNWASQYWETLPISHRADYQLQADMQMDWKSKGWLCLKLLSLLCRKERHSGIQYKVITNVIRLVPDDTPIRQFSFTFLQLSNVLLLWRVDLPPWIRFRLQSQSVSQSAIQQPSHHNWTVPYLPIGKEMSESAALWDYLNNRHAKTHAY